ncbi:hypothetical protein ABZ357_01935 [Streptomyces sp. NPDC005917]|uniref:hypothetical protein n=1 Tax=unclassified Streptomyces TaxID=2593676 RepID=UPI0033F1B8E3
MDSRDGIGTAAGAASLSAGAGRGASRTASVAAALSVTRRCTDASLPLLAAGEADGRPLGGTAGGVVPAVGEEVGAASVLMPAAAVPVVGSGAELAAVRPLSGTGVCGVAEPVAVRRCTGGVAELLGVAGEAGVRLPLGAPLAVCRCTGVCVPAPDMPEGPPRCGGAADGAADSGAADTEGVAGDVEEV